MKKILVCSLLIIMTLTGCAKEEAIKEEVELSSITINGLSDKIIARYSNLDVFEGITVLGNDNLEYNDSIKVYTDGCMLNEDNTLYTQKSGMCYITYIAVVEGIYVKEIITITIQ